MNAPSSSTLAAHLIATAGANPDPDTAGLLAGMILDRLQYPAGGGSPVVVDRGGRAVLDADGRPKTVESLIGEFRRELPQLFASARPATSPHPITSGGKVNVTAKAAAEHAAAQARQSTGQPANPYAKATRNLTQQVLMEKNNPEMAAQMKAAAGV